VVQMWSRAEPTSAGFCGIQPWCLSRKSGCFCIVFIV
jgi:hypothetical protein